MTKYNDYFSIFGSLFPLTLKLHLLFIWVILFYSFLIYILYLSHWWFRWIFIALKLYLTNKKNQRSLTIKNGLRETLEVILVTILIGILAFVRKKKSNITQSFKMGVFLPFICILSSCELGYCYGLNVYVSPKSVCWNPTPHCDGTRRWGL